MAISGIDVTLENGGSISGVVAVPEGVNVQDGYVTVYTTLKNKWAGSSEVAADGSYTVGGLNPVRTRCRVRSYGANASQRWWDDASDFQSATLVDVQSGQDTPSNNVTLRETVARSRERDRSLRASICRTSILKCMTTQIDG